MDRDLPWPHQREAAKKCAIGDVELAKATYQVEVFGDGESYWPFLQFDQQGKLKDAFCSCDSEEEGCVHLAAAFLRIFGKSGIPLHVRFERSFFPKVCRLFAQRYGYDDVAFDTFNSLAGMQIETQGKAQEKLEALLLNRVKETPETSIKFSNFSQEEVSWWREGRPSPELRFQLSYWFDLAKWMFLMEDSEAAKVSFDEDEEGFPTKITLKWNEATVRLALTKEELIELIPVLESIQSPLTVTTEKGGLPTAIAFEGGRLRVEHEAKQKKEDVEAHTLDGWNYRSGEGFFARKGEGFFNRNFIPANEIGEAVEKHREVMEKFFEIHDEKLQLSYAMRFDEQWNWCFSAYLKKPGDLKGALFGKWVYQKQGFFSVEGMLFETEEARLAPHKVAPFVNHHRVWLNTQEGFQPHLASIESHLTYKVSEQGVLTFHSKAYAGDEPKGAHDFGDWIYYEGQGFFSKQHARLGQVVRPNLEVHGDKISSFIKVNREELESIPHFFTTRLPVQRRGVEAKVLTPTSIALCPTYEGEKGIRFFGDFAYLEGEGFSELPAEFRLPEFLQREREIEGKELAGFLHDTLPAYEKYFSAIDPQMRRPHKYEVQIGYLVRAQGGLKAELFFGTEQGKINVLEVHDAFEKKYSYLFTEAGLIDLTDEQFTWMKNVKTGEGDMVELSMMEFLKLEASVTLISPTGLDPQSDISRRLLKELREFTVLEKPNLKGLKSTLRLYQETGLNWLWFLYKNGLCALLCDDMGLGKTHQSMALMAAILGQPNFSGGRFLVVCPTSVIYHWQDKLETFLPAIKVHTFHGLKRSLKKVPKEGLILTSYGTLRMEKEALKKIRFELAVFDEVQVAKNSSSQIHAALCSLDTKMSVGLTGTPIENNLRELKALFDIVLPGYMPSEARFRELFINPIERDLDAEKKAQLTTLIRPFILRRRKSEVLDELPEKSEDKAYCDLSPKQIALYKETLAKRSDALVSELRDRDTTIPFIHIFSLLSTLKQVCNHPALALGRTEEYKQYASGKWDLFTELLDEAHASKQKVVVFTQYLGMLDIMEAYLQEKKWGYAQIRGSTVNRKDELKRFQEDPNCTVFLGSLQAAGLGIDLTAAQIVIMYDRWWNAARENQAVDRVHRIGQKWGVQVFKLISKGTIEEKIDKMITKKGRLMEEIITADDQGVLKKFSRSELIDLLSFSPSD